MSSTATGQTNDGPHATIESERVRRRDELARAAASAGLTLGEYAERMAAVERATTTEEIDATVQSLPDDAAVSPRRLPRWVIAVLGGSEQRGRWRLRRRVFVLAALGGVTLDLSAAEAEGPESSITVVAIFGGADITAPPDVAVELSGLALMGGKADKRSPGPPLPGSPVVRINAFAFFGGVALKDSEDT